MTNRKVGILNFHFSDHNYGAVLQAAALEEVVKSMGYNAEHIDFVPVDENKRSKRYQLLSAIKSFVEVIDFLNLIPVPGIKNQRSFERFRTKWISRSSRFDSKSKLVDSNIYDSVIVGSDQVWRANYTKENAEVYFLSFCSSRTQKISYAASFGVDTWDLEDDIKTNKIKDLLHNFDAISVREISGIEICKNTFEIDAQQVLDPTLLVDKKFYKRIINEENISIKNRKLVYYKLDLDQEFEKMIMTAESICNVPAKNIYYEKNSNNRTYLNVGEWLAELENSEFIITDSFHCVCFALIFNKPFAVLTNAKRGIARIDSLLGMFDLKDRICYSNDDVIELLGKNDLIDYRRVNSTLESYQNKSSKYLAEALGN